MAKIKVTAGVIVVAGIASILVWQNIQNGNLRDDNERLKQILAGLKQLSEGSAPAVTDDALNDEQRAELLKLRAEVSQLRAQTNQIAALTDANQKLKDSLREARTAAPTPTASQKKKPEDALPQDIHPKETWAFRGYASPEATVESTLWGMMKGDKDTALKAFSPEMLPEMERQMEGKDFAEEMKKINMSEFRVLDRQQISPDEMVLTIYTARQDDDGNKVENSQEDTVFKRINGEWKVTKDKPPAEN